MKLIADMVIIIRGREVGAVQSGSIVERQDCKKVVELNCIKLVKGHTTAHSTHKSPQSQTVHTSRYKYAAIASVVISTNHTREVNHFATILTTSSSATK